MLFALTPVARLELPEKKALSSCCSRFNWALSVLPSMASPDIQLSFRLSASLRPSDAMHAYN